MNGKTMTREQLIQAGTAIGKIASANSTLFTKAGESILGGTGVPASDVIEAAGIVGAAAQKLLELIGEESKQYL